MISVFVVNREDDNAIMGIYATKELADKSAEDYINHAKEYGRTAVYTVREYGVIN